MPALGPCSTAPLGSVHRQPGPWQPRALDSQWWLALLSGPLTHSGNSKEGSSEELSSEEEDVWSLGITRWSLLTKVTAHLAQTQGSQCCYLVLQSGPFYPRRVPLNPHPLLQQGNWTSRHLVKVPAMAPHPGSERFGALTSPHGKQGRNISGKCCF